MGLLSFVLSFLIAPFVYENIASIVNSDKLNCYSYDFIKKIAYYVIVALFFGLFIASVDISIRNHTSRLTNYAIISFVNALIQSISIFIYPLILSERMGVRSIFVGYKLVIRYFRKSYSLNFLVFMIWLINALFIFVNGGLYHENIMVWIALNIFQSYIFHYFDFYFLIIATIAVKNLMKLNYKQKTTA